MFSASVWDVEARQVAEERVSPRPPRNAFMTVASPSPGTRIEMSASLPKTGEILITESDGKWYLRLSRQRRLREAEMFLFGGVFLIGGGIWMDCRFAIDPVAYWRDYHPFVVLGSLTAILLWGCSVWIWRLGKAPLCVNALTGAVHFGSKQLCGPGMVEAVLLRSPADQLEDTAGYYFEFRLTDATIVKVPSPSFTAIGTLECVSALARQLAVQLNVPVIRLPAECIDA